MTYTTTNLIMCDPYFVALHHPAQPAYKVGPGSIPNTADGLDHTLAWFKDHSEAKLICEVLNNLDPQTSKDYARLETLTPRLPDLEAEEIPRQSEVRIYAGDARIALACRADGKPANREAALLVGLKAETRRVLDARRAEFIAEVPVKGSAKPALVDATDAAAVTKAGPWSWDGQAVVNTHAVRLHDFIMEPAALIEETAVGDPLDCRRAKLGVQRTTRSVEVVVPECAVDALRRLSPAELGALVLGGAA